MGYHAQNSGYLRVEVTGINALDISRFTFYRWQMMMNIYRKMTNSFWCVEK